MKLDRETRMTISVLARNGQSGRAIARSRTTADASPGAYASSSSDAIGFTSICRSSRSNIGPDTRAA